MSMRWVAATVALVALLGLVGISLLLVYGTVPQAGRLTLATTAAPRDSGPSVSAPVPTPTRSPPPRSQPTPSRSVPTRAAPAATAPRSLVGPVWQPPTERRLPLAGADGFTVVLLPDGASWVEGPDGKRTPLTGPGEPPLALDEQELLRQTNLRLQQAKRPPKIGPTRLIVLDEGVVDIPLEAVITLQAADRLIALHPDGTSVIYYADGRVEPQGRRVRRP